MLPHKKICILLTFISFICLYSFYSCKKTDVVKNPDLTDPMAVLNLPAISFNYAKLLSKIHEKIESLQNEIKGNHFEDCDSGHDFETHQNIEFAIEELKSLLEDKK